VLFAIPKEIYIYKLQLLGAQPFQAKSLETSKPAGQPKSFGKLSQDNFPTITPVIV
jgi:hypothetical protein